MKILSFTGQPFSNLLEEVRDRIGLRTKRVPWISYEEISCLCVPKEMFAKHEDHFMKFKPLVEDNVVVRLHAESEDEIPWGVKYIGANKLWNKGQGENIKIAVIDTGISRSHFDLRDQVKGGVRLVGGGINGHGTHVAGIIVAEINHRGIVGVSPRAHLYDVKAFRADGTATMDNIMRGIDWSIRNKMDIINMSFGTPQYSEAMARLIRKASANGITMIASAGNNGAAVEYPARYPGVIGVGAIDRTGKLAEFSSRGKGMNVTAPGVDILSTWPGNQFKTLNGTSMAAPHITGITALRLAQRRGRK